MVNFLKFFLSTFLFLCVHAALAQIPLTYQVLIAENVSMGTHRLNQFDTVLPGDTLQIKSTGYLALISNYFHAIEAKDTVLVVPDLGLERLGKEHERPDLRKLFADKPIFIGGSVDHATYYFKLFYPKRIHVLSTGITNTIPIAWNDYRSKGDRVNPRIQIKSIFDDEVEEFEIEGDSICLNLNDHPKAKEQLNEDKVLVISLSQPHMHGDSFAVELPTSANWTQPFSSCKITDASAAVSFAMFLEYNHGAFRKDIEPYYKLATQLSSNSNYTLIYQYFLTRKKRSSN
jgi:hypothetical protein